ncbi:MAG: dienelactone hydrolase family protein [Akkermansiaceae bacterium]
MKSIFTSIIVAAFALVSSVQAIERKIVEYKDGDTLLEGYHVATASTDVKQPLVVIVHQWKGLTQYEKDRADALAKLGNNVFCVDIYGKGIRPKDNAEAGQQATIYKNDRKLFRQRLLAGLETAKGLGNIDKNKIVAIGYCFGGTGVIELARAGADVSTVVSFHGGLDSPNLKDGADIKAKVVVHHGAVDPFVKPNDLAAFMNEMMVNNKELVFISYPDAVHAFTQKMAGNDPSKGAAYNKLADQKSWASLLALLHQLALAK